MAKRSLDDLRRTPAYQFIEAAHYLNMPVTTLRAWCVGQNYYTHGEKHRFQPVIRLDGIPREGLSFLNLIEAHVLAAIRRKHDVPLPKVRDAVAYVAKILKVSRPLADVNFETDGVNLFVRRLNQLLNVSLGGQVASEELLRAHLRRVERDDAGIPIKLFPFTRTDVALSAPAPVEMDPRIAFGRPVIRGRAVPTAVLAERFKAGDSISFIAEDLEIQHDVVEDAIRCELERAA
ncbi:MAG TPA: DUF433 domain-containing protein [Steroidobacteraceae bacterium]|nr:DUF433 domain-containing protein [Steroidobacteraceae bacterium]